MRVGSLQMKKIGPPKNLHTWADELSVAALPLFPAPLSKNIFLCHYATKWMVMQIKVSNADTPVHLDNLHMYIQQARQNNDIVIQYLILDLPYLNVTELWRAHKNRWLTHCTRLSIKFPSSVDLIYNYVIQLAPFISATAYPQLMSSSTYTT